jgi:hypothetical protein
VYKCNDLFCNIKIYLWLYYRWSEPVADLIFVHLDLPKVDADPFFVSVDLRMVGNDLILVGNDLPKLVADLFYVDRDLSKVGSDLILVDGDAPKVSR